VYVVCGFMALYKFDFNFYFNFNVSETDRLITIVELLYKDFISIVAADLNPEADQSAVPTSPVVLVSWWTHHAS